MDNREIGDLKYIAITEILFLIVASPEDFISRSIDRDKRIFISELVLDC